MFLNFKNCYTKEGLKLKKSKIYNETLDEDHVFEIVDFRRIVYPTCSKTLEWPRGNNNNKKTYIVLVTNTVQQLRPKGAAGTATQYLGEGGTVS